MSRFDLVIVDCDGVLIDSERIDSERIVVQMDAEIRQERG